MFVERHRGGEEGTGRDGEEARGQQLQLAQLDVEDELQPREQLLPQLQLN